MKTQFITDEKGNRLAVILPISEYNKIIEYLDDIEDIKLYDSAKKGNQEFVNVEEAFEEIEKTRKQD